MKPCSDCPFKRDTPLDGHPEWLGDVMRFSSADKYFYHSCHKTDPNADGFAGAKKRRECAGHIQIMMNQIEKTPGRGGVYNSVNEMVERYCRKWLGDDLFEKLRRESKQVKVLHINQK